MTKLPWTEVVDDKKGFMWRMRLDGEITEWCHDYQGILVHIFKDGRTFGSVSAFYVGVLPELKPFQLGPAVGTVEKVKR